MIRDEVVVVGADQSYEPRLEPCPERKGRHGDDRNKDSGSGAGHNGNVFAAIIEFFAGLGKNKNKKAPAAAAAAGAAGDSERGDATTVSTTPLTAHDSEPGEDCCSELHDNESGPLSNPRCSFYPSMVGGQPRRKTSQPVAIKRGPGTRARAPRPPEPVECDKIQSEKSGYVRACTREESAAPGDDAESKIKAWQRRRMSAKRESFTEETFVPCYATLTTNMSSDSFHDMKYKAPETRVPSAVAPPSSVARPNYHDALRRVAVVVYQHIKTCQWKRQAAEERERIIAEAAGDGPPKDMKSWRRSAPSLAALRAHESALWGAGGRDATRWEGDQSSGEVNGFNARMAEVFDEQHFISPTFRYNFMDAPTMALPGVMFTLRQVRSPPKTPTVDEIYEFIKTLFNKAQLSSECSLVCLIYVERLMEKAHVPLLAGTWKPVLLCGLLLASKVWQDLSSWNVEFSTVYPEYSLKSINRLELLFLGAMKWDMSISSSLYAKYYFALRSLTEKEDFRRRYNRVLKIDAPRASIVAARADVVKREVINTQSEVRHNCLEGAHRLDCAQRKEDRNVVPVSRRGDVWVGGG
eukprot:g12630.t1